MAVPKTFAHGLDLSHWDGSYNALKKPMDFVILKASEGTDYRDPLFKTLLKSSATVPIKAAYHYYRSGQDWKRQANNLLNVIVGSGVHFLAFDYEKINNTLNAQTDGDAKKFVDFVSAELPCVLYLNYAEYKAMISRGSTWMKNYDLWIARWFEKNYYHTKATSPGINNWKLWQFGGDYVHPDGWTVPGYHEGQTYGTGSDNVDLDVYNGTLAQMKEWLKVGNTPPPAQKTLEQRVVDLETLAEKARTIARQFGYEL